MAGVCADAAAAICRGSRQTAGLGVVRLKDEAGRFGLGSFKALGGAYAVAEVVAGELARRGVAPAATSAELMAGRWQEATAAITVTCATDGNHGRAVAWGARRSTAGAVIFIHEGVSAGRAAAIAAYGAEIRRVPGTYDDSVRVAAAEAAANGWFVVSDTSWQGYTEVPRAIMQGYRVMADEAVAQWGVAQWGAAPPTHVFIQGGVGGVAAAVSVQARTALTPRADAGGGGAGPGGVPAWPRPSWASGRAVPGELDTLMAGLACGEPSLLAWQELDRGAAAFMAIPDDAAVEVMRLLARAGVVAGEFGRGGAGRVSAGGRRSGGAGGVGVGGGEPGAGVQHGGSDGSGVVCAAGGVAHFVRLDESPTRC